ncbi:MAG: choice-of-anchor D domain-containing protein [Candidatus Geothermincolia bacterium]
MPVDDGVIGQERTDMGSSGTREMGMRKGPPSRFATIAAAIAIVFALAFGIAPGQAAAAQVTLAWDKNTEPDVSGYKLYYGTSSGVYGTPIAVPGVNTTTRMVDGLEDGRGYFFAVTAYDTYGNESGYSNEVSYTPGPGAAPEINLVGNGVNIPDGASSPATTDFTDFGGADIKGGTVMHTFTIQNTGSAVLKLSGRPRVKVGGTNAGNFKVMVQPPSSVAASGSATFQVRFDPSAAGTRLATLVIANNDSDERLYNFAIRGTGTTAPEINLIGNGRSIVDGDTTPATADFTDFGVTDVVKGAITRTFTIKNTGSGALALTGLPLVAVGGANAADFTVTTLPVSPVAAGGSRTFQVRFDPSAAGTRVATISIANNDGDENPYDFAVQGTGTTPEITVSGNGMGIASGDNTPAVVDFTNFGGTDVVGGTVTRIFTIQNTGTGALQLYGRSKVTLSGDGAADFKVTLQPPSSIPVGVSKNFQVRFAPTTAGVRVATISIASNDVDENPYAFAIQGTYISYLADARPATTDATAASAAVAETITKPAAPGGPTSLSAGAAYTFTAHGAASSIGDPIQYRFSWADGTASAWLPAGVAAATKSWAAAGTYSQVQVQARCANHPSVISAVSAPLTVTVGPAAAAETIARPGTPAGASSLPAMATAVYKAGGAVSSSGDALQYRLHWSDGTASAWLPVGVLEASKSWSVPGSYGVWAEARCALHTTVVATSAAPLTVNVAPGADEILTEPAHPIGAGEGQTGFLYAFDAIGASSSAGDPVQYRFQWGDGTASDWVTADEANLVQAWKFWPVEGRYTVTAEARCSVHPGLTIPSASVEVEIVRGDPEMFFDTFDAGADAVGTRWQAVSGGWVVNPDETFATDSQQPDNIAIVGTIPEFTAGRLTARVKLASGSTNPFAGIIFAYTDAGHYRYVALTESNLYLGQAGESAAEPDGVKANVQRAVELDTWQQLRVDAHPDGEVRVYLGQSELPALTFRFGEPVGGWVGCSANTSEVLFDDFGIWDERVLLP